MNTETTATPEAIPTPNIQAVDFTSESKQLHRKIAKLPKPLRDIINSSLDDGLPAREIIHKLETSTNPPLPYPISEANISGWKTTGYQRYLAQQEHRDSIEASREAALEMVAANNLSLPQATLQVIASQCFQILGDFSPAAIKQKLADDPLKYISLLHVFARLTREMVHLEKYHEAKAAAQAEAAAKNPQARPVPEEKKTEIVTGEMDRIFRRRDPRRAMAAQLLRASKPAVEPVSPPLASSDGERAGLAGSSSSPIEIQKSKISLKTASNAERRFRPSRRTVNARMNIARTATSSSRPRAAAHNLLTTNASTAVPHSRTACQTAADPCPPATSAEPASAVSWTKTSKNTPSNETIQRTAKMRCQFLSLTPCFSKVCPPLPFSSIKIQKSKILMLPHNCLPRRYNDRRQFIRFGGQTRQSFRGNKSALRQQFQPKRRFVGFLLCHTKFIDKIGARPRSACCPVICSHRSSSSQQLVAQSSPYKIFRQRARQFNHSQRKHFRPLFHFILGHNFEFGSMDFFQP